MRTPSQGSAFLEELRQFLEFLKSLWGLLAGFSTAFPLSNALTHLIPLRPEDYGAFDHITPELVTTIATMTTLFVVLWTYGERHAMKSAQKSRLIDQPWFSFLTGLGTLCFYLAVTFTIYHWAYLPLGIEGGDPGRVVGDLVLTLAYSALFALLTRAFMLLAMREYFG